MPRSTPRQAAEHARRESRVPAGGGERFAGYGVMGLPFSSGDYLAFRDWPASSIGPGYRAVWHRDPAGRWTIYADAPPEVSCARYIGAEVHETVVAPIAVDWSGDTVATVRVAPDIEWELELAGGVTTGLLTAVARRMPARAWHSSPMLLAMGMTSGQLLRTGRLRLAGVAPNGQRFEVTPREMWAVRRSRARVRWHDLGEPRPLGRQCHLRDIWLPQRGVYYAATTAGYTAPAAQAPPDLEHNHTRQHGGDPR